MGRPQCGCFHKGCDTSRDSEGGGGDCSSSPGAVPFPRELNPLFGSQIGKPPIWIWWSKQLAGLLCVVGPYIPFRGRTGMPRRLGEPQSTGGEHRRYSKEEVFSSHGFCLWVEAPTFNSPRHRAPISVHWLPVWNESGEFRLEAPEARDETDFQRSRSYVRDRSAEPPTLA